MKQEAFEARHGPAWSQLEQWIVALGDKRGGKRGARRADGEPGRIGREYPRLYRQVCHHLAIARARRYSLGLQARLNGLALDGHQYLYRPRSNPILAILELVLNDFPVAFRRHWRFMAAATALFVLPGLLMGIAVQLGDTLIFSLLAPHEVSQIEQMYDPANRVLGRERASDSDVAMFGFYIYNNITIGFQTFAGGLVFGLGSIFFLSFNGLSIGAIASHLTAVGYSSTFWPFVAGHSSLELTAIVVFGGSGLSIGFGAVAPGRRSRWQAIRDRALAALPLVYGATAMLIGAAFVEAFWSSTTWPTAGVKYSVGAGLWLLVLLYFAFLGQHES